MLANDEINDILGETFFTEEDDATRMNTQQTLVGGGAGGPAYRQFLKVWMNELQSPEILQYQEALLSTTRQNVADQAEELEMKSHLMDPFVVLIFQQELERIKYVIRSYLRCRLLKIEKYCSNCLQNQYERYKLSSDELSYCERFQEIILKCHQDSFVQHLPKDLHTIVDDNTVVKPNLEDAVFCRVNANLGAVQAGDGDETVQMLEGDMFLYRYKAIRQLLQDGKVDLI